MSGLYSTPQWRSMRRAQLYREPLCAYCLKTGRVCAASVADHVVPHKGNERLFFDASNLQSLCKTHHDSAKQREEKTGHVQGCDVNGMPLDPNHAWSTND